MGVRKAARDLMSKIIVGNTLCTIENEEDIEFLRALDKELSFKVQGAEHTKAFKGYFQGGRFIKWDGIRRILSRDLTFPYGLLERVKLFYGQHNKTLDLDNRRPGKSEAESISIYDKLVESGKTPYQYQMDALDVVKEQDCGIIRVATGGGKSLIAAMMTAQFGKSTIIYVVGKDLLHQMHKFCSSVFDDEVGIIGDGICEIRDINIASVWTVGQALGMKKSAILADSSDGEKALNPQKYIDIKAMMKLTKVHIFDECHLAACDTIQNISRNINPEHVYGMSASPWRDDGADLLIESIFGSKI
jgi:superfamily II DNA or RNA helicase